MTIMVNMYLVLIKEVIAFMTEEIKKILNYLKNDNYETEAPADIEVSNYDLFKVINSVDNDKLLNYITNLQQENEKLKETLQTDKLMKAFMAEHNRNEKAIEYIENNNHIDGCLIKWEVADLLNILKGSDEE
jgi:hypothetical protein